MVQQWFVLLWMKMGIPKKAEERFAIAKRIIERAMEYGIPKEDLIIDCLTLTASAEQDGVVETLKAISMVKEKLGLKTVLGGQTFLLVFREES